MAHGQTTTLDYDPNDVLGSWTASTNGGVVTSGSEQIGFDGLTMHAADPLAGGGNFLWGDFSLWRDPTRGDDGLVLVNDYGSGFNAFDHGVRSLAADASALTISGTLLLSTEWSGAFGGTATFRRPRLRDTTDGRAVMVTFHVGGAHAVCLDRDRKKRLRSID